MIDQSNLYVQVFLDINDISEYKVDFIHGIRKMNCKKVVQHIRSCIPEEVTEPLGRLVLFNVDTNEVFDGSSALSN
ncbi:hypothetical protein GGI00_006883, partial [Coemansia sp. RSA 2681]